jgi:hypothetical protein
LLFWITTEALRTGSPRLELGPSLNAFMRALGLDPSRGGPRSDARRLRDQMERLFRATISFEQHVAGEGYEGSDWLNMRVTSKGHLWWDLREPDQPQLFDSYIVLSEEFFQAITSAPVPANMQALKALKRSPLALDLYAFVSYRAFVTTQTGKAQFVTWAQLAGQLGTDYADVTNFRKKTKAALRKIKVVFPGMRLGSKQGGIEILPGASAVPPRPPVHGRLRHLASG